MHDLLKCQISLLVKYRQKFTCMKVCSHEFVLWLPYM